MSRHPVSVGGRADAADYKHELLGRLGLRADASDQDVEMARNGLIDFLELAPRELKSWAATQTADVDEAFALLSGPEQDLVRAAQPAAMAEDGQAGQDTLSDTPPPPPPATTPSAPVAPATPPTPNPRRNLIIGLVAAVAVIGIIFGVAQMGKTDVPPISGKPTGTETTAAAADKTVPVDQTKVAALMKKISANPKDVASLQGLGDIYFAAGDYKNAIAWEEKVLVADPKNQIALLALGAAQFNAGNAAGAEKQWLIAAKLYPNVAEVHYDLGFLYMSQTPPNTAKMKVEWAKVVAIDPTSELAKTVAQHVGGAPGASATPSAK